MFPPQLIELVTPLGLLRDDSNLSNVHPNTNISIIKYKIVKNLKELQLLPSPQKL